LRQGYAWGGGACRGDWVRRCCMHFSSRRPGSKGCASVTRMASHHTAKSTRECAELASTGALPIGCHCSGPLCALYRARTPLNQPWLLPRSSVVSTLLLPNSAQAPEQRCGDHDSARAGASSLTNATMYLKQHWAASRSGPTHSALYPHAQCAGPAARLSARLAAQNRAP